MEAWLSFHDVTTVQNCVARVLDFHCKHMIYTAAIELSDLIKGECPTPSSAKATINIDHNGNIKIIAINGNCIKACSVPSRRSTSIKRDHRSFVDMVIAS